MADSPPYPGAPRWVKVLGSIALVLVLLFVVLMFTRGPHRGHGPRDHLPKQNQQQEIDVGDGGRHDSSKRGH
jgi:hypothetical protein